MALLFYAGILLCTWAIWTTNAMFRNYQRAKSIGLPIIIVPIDTLNPAAQILTNLPFYKHLMKAPFGIGRALTLMAFDWGFHTKYEMHSKFGPAFVMVTPASNWLMQADPDATASLLHRRKDFIKPGKFYDVMNIFGPNVDGLEGDDWQRHRRLTAPSFNERLSSTVWQEASRQAIPMLTSWVRKGQTGIRSSIHDATTLALHVLTHAGLGVSYSFDAINTKLDPGHTLSYRDATSGVVRRWVILVIFPRWMMNLPFVPAFLHRTGQAAMEFQKYMEEMVQKVRSIGDEFDPNAPPNLMSTLIRASEQAILHDRTEKQSERATGLSDQEIYGNIFIYNLAGHETTANTISYTTALMAAYPSVQGWLSEEIVQVVGDTPLSDLQYDSTFPKLKRCMAVMYETLRLYGSVPMIPKSTTPNNAVTLTIAGTEHTIPPNTIVVTNGIGLHTDPASWGEDALTWRPGRWIETASTASPTSPAASETLETLIEPRPGSFVPWADGPRVCPGRKFAQVEFVSVMVALFKDHRVSPVPEGDDQSEAGMRKVVLDMVRESSVRGLTLRMECPEKVALRWEKVR